MFANPKFTVFISWKHLARLKPLVRESTERIIGGGGGGVVGS